MTAITTTSSCGSDHIFRVFFHCITTKRSTGDSSDPILCGGSSIIYTGIKKAGLCWSENDETANGKPKATGKQWPDLLMTVKHRLWMSAGHGVCLWRHQWGYDPSRKHFLTFEKF